MFEHCALESGTRRRLYEIICEFPGLHFREIQRKAGIGDGALQYNLDILKRHKIVETIKQGILTRFYPPHLTTEEKLTLGFLRKQSTRNIILFLLTHGDANHEDITKAVKLSPSSVSWHLKALERNGMIQTQRHGRECCYLFANKEQVIKILRSYRQSFTDKLVDNFLSIWE